jgi:hypothetical protein
MAGENIELTYGLRYETFIFGVLHLCGSDWGHTLFLA